MAQANLYAVQDIPGKGQAVVATSKIPKGARILAEHPLIIIPRLSTNLEEIDRLVNEQLGKLDHDSRSSNSSTPTPGNIAKQ
ncbi:hypothetical protein BJX66DRAFT_320120 [Aspergillus keveii]|uniref:Uncharacterized protein n=1 Tax=Aspergillus keveii TaxID=714993 RepID=A0ABR4FHH2_9EURO